MTNNEVLAEGDNMPEQTTKTIDLTEDQRKALFGDTPCTQGEEYTVVLKAGDLDSGSGMQTFEVNSKATEQENSAADKAADAELAAESSPEEDESSPEAEVKALGYDRKKAMAGRRKEAPKISAKDLEND